MGQKELFITHPEFSVAEILKGYRYGQLPEQLVVNPDFSCLAEVVNNLTAFYGMEFGGFVLNKRGRLDIEIGGEKYPESIRIYYKHRRKFRTMDQTFGQNPHFIVSDRDRSMIRSQDGVNDKTKIISGKEALAIFHSHPDNNLPSPNDLRCLLREPNFSEVVISPDYLHFLVVCKDTKKASARELERIDSIFISNYRRCRKFEYPQDMDREEFERRYAYKFLQQQCSKYKVGYYIARIGNVFAKRVD